MRQQVQEANARLRIGEPKAEAGICETWAKGPAQLKLLRLGCCCRLLGSLSTKAGPKGWDPGS